MDAVTFVSSAKTPLLKRCGTREVWLISPETRETTVYTAEGCRLHRGSDVITTDLLRGFSLTLGSLFEGL